MPTRVYPKCATQMPGLYRNTPLLITATLFTLLIPSIVFATELRGRILDPDSGRAPEGGRLILKCRSPEFGAEISLNPDGSYSIGNVPPGSNCRLTVNAGHDSATREIHVRGTVVRYDAEVRKVGDRMVLIAR